MNDVKDISTLGYSALTNLAPVVCLKNRRESPQLHLLNDFISWSSFL
jgi:hypothetical protein